MLVVLDTKKRGQCPIPDEEGAKITMFHSNFFLAVTYARTIQGNHHSLLLVDHIYYLSINS